MFRKFLEGLGFGAGFAISAVIILFASQKILSPSDGNMHVSTIQQSQKWRSLSYEEQI